MTDKKITDLTAMTDPADDDLLVVVDDSATQTKKITWSNAKVALGGNVTAGGSPTSSDFAKFSDATTIGPRSYGQVRQDLNVEDGADVTDATNVNAAGAVMESDYDAKGDILIASADDTPTKLSVGTDDQILIADSGETTGTKWGAFPGITTLTLSADSGSDQTITDTNTIEIAGGTGIDTVAGATDTVTIALADEQFTSALKTKLDAIEASADVTDDTNVNAAGAVMESDFDAKGDVLIGTADNTVDRIAIGSNDEVLTADSGEATGVKWAPPTLPGAVEDSDFNAKGDILSASTDDTPLILSVGTNSQVLSANSSKATGLEWVSSSTPGAHKDSHDPNDGSDKLDTANAAEISTVVAAGTGTSHSFARADHVHAINHAISNNHLATYDGTQYSGEIARMTTNGIESRTDAEMKTQLGYMTDLVDDTTPQLGGNLDLNSKVLTGSLTVSPDGTNEVLQVNDGTIDFSDGNAGTAGTATVDSSGNISYNKNFSATDLDGIIGSNTPAAITGTSVAANGILTVSPDGTNEVLQVNDGTIDVTDGNAGTTGVMTIDSAGSISFDKNFAATDLDGIVGSNTPAAGSFTTIGASGNVTPDTLTASKPVFTDGSKNLVSTGTLGADQGGTGLATITDHGVMLGSGTSAVTPTDSGAAGEVLVSGGASADPDWEYRPLENQLTNSGWGVWSNSEDLYTTAGTVPAAADAYDMVNAASAGSGTVWTGATGATRPTGWDQLSGREAVFTIFDSGDGAPHDVCLKFAINATPVTNPGIVADFTTVVGKLYEFSFDFKHGTATSGYVGIGTSSGGAQYGVWTTLTDAAWTTYTHVFEATTATTYIFLQTTSGTNGQFELFDQVSLHEVTPGITSGASTGPDNWQKHGDLEIFREQWSGVAGEFGDAYNVQAGSIYSLKMVADSASNYVRTPGDIGAEDAWIARFAGRTVTAGMWIKTATASSVRFCVHDGDGARNYSDYHTGGGGWEWIEKTESISSSATLCRLEIYCVVNPTTAYISQPQLSFASSLGTGNYTQPSGEWINCELKIPIFENASPLPGDDETLNMEALSNGMVPKGAIALDFTVQVSNSVVASANGIRIMQESPHGNESALYCYPYVADLTTAVNGVVNCDANGDVYQQISEEGTTLSAYYLDVTRVQVSP